MGRIVTFTHLLYANAVHASINEPNERAESETARVKGEGGSVHLTHKASSKSERFVSVKKILINDRTRAIRTRKRHI